MNQYFKKQIPIEGAMTAVREAMGLVGPIDSVGYSLSICPKSTYARLLLVRKNKERFRDPCFGLISADLEDDGLTYFDEWLSSEDVSRDDRIPARVTDEERHSAVLERSVEVANKIAGLLGVAAVRVEEE